MNDETMLRPELNCLITDQEGVIYKYGDPEPLGRLSDEHASVLRGAMAINISIDEFSAWLKSEEFQNLPESEQTHYSKVGKDMRASLSALQKVLSGYLEGYKHLLNKAH